MESLSGDSFIRYQKITDIMVNEYGYNLISKESKYGETRWLLKRNVITPMNEDMDDEIMIEHFYTKKEILRNKKQESPPTSVVG